MIHLAVDEVEPGTMDAIEELLAAIDRSEAIAKAKARQDAERARRP